MRAHFEMKIPNSLVVLQLGAVFSTLFNELRFGVGEGDSSILLKELRFGPGDGESSTLLLNEFRFSIVTG